MRTLALFAALGLIAITSGCVAASHGDVKGRLYTKTTSTISDVDNSVGMSGKGEATATGIICFATGDSSVGAAMQQGGLSKVHHVDADVMEILGIYAVHKTIVHGE